MTKDFISLPFIFTTFVKNIILDNNKKPSTTTEKKGLHPRNPFRFKYDFEVLTQALPELKPFVHMNKHGIETIDFNNPEAVLTLNRAILKHQYQIEYWNIPKGYLCPPVPGRADYIHHIADLLKLSNQGKFPNGKKVNVLDVGTGANCIYPIIGNRTFRWQFVGSEVDPRAIKCANQIVESNTNLSKEIEIRTQENVNNIFHGVIEEDDFFDLTVCNPPFFASVEEAAKKNNRKIKNLGVKSSHNALNFGGQNTEFWTKGGEKAFIDKMIKQSQAFDGQCLWFTTLVSNARNLPFLEARLKNAGALRVKIIEMAQGQKTSRILCWTFLSKKEHEEWVKQRWSVEAKEVKS